MIEGVSLGETDRERESVGENDRGSEWGRD